MHDPSLSQFLYAFPSHFCFWSSKSKQMTINPFVPGPLVTALANPRPFYRLWYRQFLRSRTALSANLCRVKRSFKPYQSEHESVRWCTNLAPLSPSVFHFTCILSYIDVQCTTVCYKYKEGNGVKASIWGHSEELNSKHPAQKSSY